jgi:uncharacterized Ntn-hydrolase superfamily protein
MKIISTLFLFSIFSISTFAQDTFSICAYDSVTGQVGSAGATCIAGTTSAVIISDVHPGVGVIHTQAYYYAANQNYGRTLMNLGTLTPQQIIDSLLTHDILSDSTKRQYGIVDLIHRETAQWTGSNCDNYKSHIHGDYYSIQGNTLLGQQILDSIESRFLNTSGNLACRLMAALQGAKVIGADTRCATFGISTFSAFIRVANPTDLPGSLYLNISVNTYPNHIDPIDSLQTMFDLWGGCLSSYAPSISGNGGIKIFPNPVRERLTVKGYQLTGVATKTVNISICSVLNETLISYPINYSEQRSTDTGSQEMSIDISMLSPGIYFVRIQTDAGDMLPVKIVKL